jgi:serine/threonine-protein kinase
MALSPDGSRLVYVGPSDSAQQRQLWVKRRDTYEATPLPGTANADGVTVSPDGEWVAFSARGTLRKMPIGGGASTTLADSVERHAGIAWLDDGTIVYVAVGWSLMRVSESGGTVTVLARPDSGSLGLVLPTALPGSRGVLFTSCDFYCVTDELRVIDLASGTARVLLRDARQGWYLPTGHLAYMVRNGEMLAAPFDLKSLELRGLPVPVLSDVELHEWVPIAAVSATGTVVMQLGNAASRSPAELLALVRVDRTGAQRLIDSAWTFRPSRGTGPGLALSPDGTRLAIGLYTNSGDDIWIKEMPAGPLARLTFDSTGAGRPRWTPDGRSVTYVASGNDLRRRSADGTGDTETVASHPNGINEALWSPDGRWLVLRTGGLAGQSGGRDIIGIRPGVDSAPVPLAAKPGVDESAAALSPDGNWLAYVSNETGRDEIYVRPFPATDRGKWQVSASGGRSPLWAHSGRELFFVDAERNMVVAPVEPVAALQLGPRRTLFTLADDLFYPNLASVYTPFDLTPDDQHFIMARWERGSAREAPRFLMVENWFEELNSKVKP